ncbi:hypothetical protein B0H17DRAFT_1151009 [Mycena rosella]|uniref:Uncharacterized protein n=1 Tax=Mycena rosella TaxID=1033263 RepID=A0AAD7FIX9_MYCRO|nr:hypothetical protein B0H17DRAFT_1151009 [Mycena rosella]
MAQHMQADTCLVVYKTVKGARLKDLPEQLVGAARDGVVLALPPDAAHVRVRGDERKELHVIDDASEGPANASERESRCESANVKKMRSWWWEGKKIGSKSTIENRNVMQHDAHGPSDDGGLISPQSLASLLQSCPG